MGLIDEIFSKIVRVTRLCKYQYNGSTSTNLKDDTILTSINNIWSEFIFKDVEKAKLFKEMGYDFILIGQDIYDKGIDMGVPTSHYSYLLVVAYDGDLINPFKYIPKLKEVLYDELITNYINIVDTPVRYSSIYKHNTSAGIFVYMHDDTSGSNTASLGSVLGDSLVYMNVGIPYLRFCCTKSIRLCNLQSGILVSLEPRNTFHITFDTHMNGIMVEKVNCQFII